MRRVILSLGLAALTAPADAFGFGEFSLAGICVARFLASLPASLPILSTLYVSVHASRTLQVELRFWAVPPPSAM